MKQQLKLSAFLIIAGLLSACASPAPKNTADVLKEVHPGDTQQQVTKKFGPANVKNFPSGYQVWVYQFHPAIPALVKYVPVVGDVAGLYDATQEKKELAILFDKNGVVKKTAYREIAAAWSQKATPQATTRTTPAPIPPKATDTRL